MTRSVIATVIGLLGLAFGLIPAVAETSPTIPVVRADSTTYVVGRDASMTVRGQLPAACAGQPVQLSLFLRDGANPQHISAFPNSSSVAAATAAADSAVAGAIPLPDSLGAPLHVFPGISGTCMAEPIVDGTLGVELAVQDPKANAGSASSVLVSPAGLASVPSGRSETFGAIISVLNVFADGKQCDSAKTDPAATGGARVVLHLGIGSQPPECSRAGATITFTNSAGQEFFTSMTLIPGATRLLENFAVTPPFTSGPAPAGPAAPNVGSGAPVRATVRDRNAGSGWALRMAFGLTLAAGAITAGLGAAAVNRHHAHR